MSTGLTGAGADRSPATVCAACATRDAELAVDREAARLGGVRDHSQRAVDLPAPEVRADPLADLRLESSEVLGKAKLHVEVPVIDGADLPLDATLVALRFGAGECGHAAQQFRLPYVSRVRPAP